jgi:hypothetical protein
MPGNAARAEKSQMGECVEAVVVELARRSRNRLLSVSLSHTVNRRVGLAGGNATTFAMAGSACGGAISWSRGGSEPLPPRGAARV